jgi:hypothetical protein
LPLSICPLKDTRGRSRDRMARSARSSPRLGAHGPSRAERAPNFRSVRPRFGLVLALDPSARRTESIPNGARGAPARSGVRPYSRRAAEAPQMSQSSGRSNRFPPSRPPSLTVKTRRYISYLTLRKSVDNLMVVVGCRARDGNWSDLTIARPTAVGPQRALGSGRSIERRD